jgi:hypothetical protein
MIISDNIKRILFYVFAILSLLAAIYHFTGIFYKINNSPVWRHAIFVFVNLFCIYGFLKRPKYFIYFYIVLLIQQFYSHGQYLIQLWELEHKVHWISIGVLVLMPIGLICLLADFKTNKIADKRNNKNGLKHHV